jgi:hypothetical protein
MRKELLSLVQGSRLLCAGFMPCLARLLWLPDITTYRQGDEPAFKSKKPALVQFMHQSTSSALAGSQ